MIKSSDVDKLTNMTEVVLYDSHLSKLAHKELYHFGDELYIHLSSDGVDSFMELPCFMKKGCPNTLCKAIQEMLNILNSTLYSHPSNIHLVLEWEHLLQVSMWNSNDNLNSDIVNLLSNAGLTFNEIENINPLNVHEMSLYLLQNARFQIFRRICHFAKRQIINRLRNKSIQIICHLSLPETKRIVASSL